jgi:hypothetical protein
MAVSGCGLSSLLNISAAMRAGKTAVARSARGAPRVESA